MSGLKTKKMASKIFHFDDAEKQSIIEDYLQSGLTKREIWEKYTGRKAEHGSILRWMYEYGYLSQKDKKNISFVRQNIPMNKERPIQEKELEFENLQQQRRILDLEKQLQESEMKAIAWQTMVEIAEREFNISIKKKYNTKPSKR
jgi:transposase-like protein